MVWPEQPGLVWEPPDRPKQPLPKNRSGKASKSSQTESRLGETKTAPKIIRREPQNNPKPRNGLHEPKASPEGFGRAQNIPTMVLKKWSLRPPQQSSGEPQNSRKLPRNGLGDLQNHTQNRLFVEPKTATKWSGSSTAPDRSVQQKCTSPTLPLLSKQVLYKLRRRNAGQDSSQNCAQNCFSQHFPSKLRDPNSIQYL